MREIFEQSDLFYLLLTLAAYQAGLWLQNRVRKPFCNPILVAAVLVGAVLLLTGMPNDRYQAGCAGMSWLLTPATVCLAIPLYTQMGVLRQNWRAILAGIAAGTLACLGCIAALAVLFRLDHTLYVSLLPKSITTAMGMAVSKMHGGLGALTTAAIIVTGIFGSCCGPWMCRLFGLHDPVARGVAFGTASHVIGTAKAAEMGPTTGAVSSLSLVVAGILTALLAPLLVPLL